MAHYLKMRGKDAVLVAYIADDPTDWRFSYVKLAYQTEISEKGRVKVKSVFTTARRYSFLVGENEPNHTAQKQLGDLLMQESRLTLNQIEDAFNIESVTKEFFEDYKDLFLQIKANLDQIVATKQQVKTEFERCEIDTANFSKKLLGQIVFLYFLQKKGWLGVAEDAAWGTGDKKFLHNLFKNKGERNYFDDILEPFFYEALAIERKRDFYPALQCKVPFLNGGLFEPLNGYDWKNTQIKLDNQVFEEVFKVFNLYNFTVREDEPLEREVAVDPEMLGRVFEKLLEIKDRKSKGAYYTPREIVHYMCQESLINYLDTALNADPQKVTVEDIESLIREGDTSLENDLAKESGRKSGDYGLPESIRGFAKMIDFALAEVKICDPAIGSGAFPVGMMNEIVRARRVLTPYLNTHAPAEEGVRTGANRTPYTFKRHAIQENLYGVDIDPAAVDIAKLRLWLSLVVDEENYKDIKPLPNLDYKIVRGNSLLGYPYQRRGLEKLEALKATYFYETDAWKKQALREQVDRELDDIFKNTKQSLGYQTDFDFRINFSEVFRAKDGFDVVIGNPPYVSTKGRNITDKKALKNVYGFADDLYSHFYFRGIETLRTQGVLAYISSKTFWTIQTKQNLRQHLLAHRFIELYDTASPFEAMVDTCIVLLKNARDETDYNITVKDGKSNLLNPVVYQASVGLYHQAVNQVIFVPSPFNLVVHEKYNEIVKALMQTWWRNIATSRDIEKNRKVLDAYRRTLKPGDVTLLGLMTEGGQGLATANNGKYVGVLEGTLYAARIRQTRPLKLLAAVRANNINELVHIQTKDDTIAFLANKSEQQIRALFDALKEKYGRDIFGQGYLFRIVSPDEIAGVGQMSEDEKLNGIKGPRTFVPYDKGDREGNRWYLRTPYYIDWSVENVHHLQQDPRARWQGYNFYFREGFCWTNVLNPNARLIKTRLKGNTACALS